MAKPVGRCTRRTSRCLFGDEGLYGVGVPKVHVEEVLAWHQVIAPSSAGADIWYRRARSNDEGDFVCRREGTARVEAGHAKTTHNKHQNEQPTNEVTQQTNNNQPPPKTKQESTQVSTQHTIEELQHIEIIFFEKKKSNGGICFFTSSSTKNPTPPETPVVVANETHPSTVMP
mmetsp:Transcript_4851/g.8777  ORF Transcript_4851/g.8777 Transcript_4851/m.8777 type:complete len:173 (-) Transcript_4851:61-579(-)